MVVSCAVAEGRCHDILPHAGNFPQNIQRAHFLQQRLKSEAGHAVHRLPLEEQM